MAIIGSNSHFLDIRQWYARLAILERQVCRIEVTSPSSQDLYATGFLVGPDVLLTVYHAVDFFIDYYEKTKKNNGGSNNPDKIIFRFDYVLSADGKEIYPGTEHYLAEKDWLIDSSVPSSSVQSGYIPTHSELDYALIRLKNNAGLELTGFEDSPRGWIELTNQPEKIEAGSPLSILSHPYGKPLSISIDTNALVGFNENKSRILYRTSTNPGSSGAPCFDINWQLIAMHESINRDPNLNMGIPINAITKTLRDRNFLDVVSKKSPHKVVIGHSATDVLRVYGNFPLDPEISRLIAEGESQHTEFKVAACRSPISKKKDSLVTEQIIKSVAAFMNSETGGILLIGISDDGNVIGINDEYAIADKSKNNWDGYYLFLLNKLNDSLDIDTPFKYYELLRHSIGEKHICSIRVKPSHKPVYIGKKLYLRTGGQSRELLGPDLVEYVNKRWTSI